MTNKQMVGWLGVFLIFAGAAWSFFTSQYVPGTIALAAAALAVVGITNGRGR